MTNRRSFMGLSFGAISGIFLSGKGQSLPMRTDSYSFYKPVDMNPNGMLRCSCGTGSNIWYCGPGVHGPKATFECPKCHRISPGGKDLNEALVNWNLTMMPRSMKKGEYDF
jgi:hypothetical protein